MRFRILRVFVLVGRAIALVILNSRKHMKLKKTQPYQRNKIKIYSLRNIFKDLIVCRNSYINFEINRM